MFDERDEARTRAWGWKETVNPDRSPGAPKRIHVKAHDDALEPIGLHECRHTFASLLIDAGVNAEAICEAMGHTSVVMTFDRYGHLMPDGHEELRSRVDTYLAAGSPPERHDVVGSEGKVETGG